MTNTFVKLSVSVSWVITVPIQAPMVIGESLHSLGHASTLVDQHSSKVSLKWDH